MGGRKPKDEDRKVTRHPLTHDWVQVPDKPFRGKRPTLPTKRLVAVRGGGSEEVALLKLTRDWWAGVSSMPHCVLWSTTDWQYAITTALVADLAYRGSTSAASELRQREAILGTTVDARRDLRIRYVTPLEAAAATEDVEAKLPTAVPSLTERRRRLMDDDDAS